MACIRGLQFQYKNLRAKAEFESRKEQVEADLQGLSEEVLKEREALFKERREYEVMKKKYSIYRDAVEQVRLFGSTIRKCVY